MAAGRPGSQLFSEVVEGPCLELPHSNVLKILCDGYVRDEITLGYLTEH